MRIIVFHRALATPEDDWYPWLSGELSKDGVETEIPVLPSLPQFESWTGIADRLLKDAAEGTIIIGHSLGNTAAFKAMEKFSNGRKICGMVAVAPVYKVVGELPEDLKPIGKFFERPVNWARVRKASEKFVVFHDRKDDHVPFESGETISRKLGAKLIATDGRGHYLDKTFPEVIDILHEMMK